jgi:hypothetical protein
LKNEKLQTSSRRKQRANLVFYELYKEDSHLKLAEEYDKAKTSEIARIGEEKFKQEGGLFFGTWTARRYQEARKENPQIEEAVKSEQNRLLDESLKPPALKYADDDTITDEERKRRDLAFQNQA